MHSVACLLDDDAVGAVEYAVADFLASTRWEAVHKVRVCGGHGHQVLVHLIGGEILFPLGLLLLLSHTRPHVGVNGRRVGDRLVRIGCGCQLQLRTLLAKRVEKLRLKLITCWRGNRKMNAQLARKLRAKLRATLLASPTQASLASASDPTCSLIVYRSASAWHGWAKSVSPLITEQVACSATCFDGGVFFAAHDDHVDKLAENFGEIVDPFALAKPDVVAEHHARAA